MTPVNLDSYATPRNISFAKTAGAVLITAYLATKIVAAISTIAFTIFFAVPAYHMYKNSAKYSTDNTMNNLTSLASDSASTFRSMYAGGAALFTMVAALSASQDQHQA